MGIKYGNVVYIFHLQNNQFKRIEGLKEQAWCLNKIFIPPTTNEKKKELLLAATSSALYQIENNKLIKIKDLFHAYCIFQPKKTVKFNGVSVPEPVPNLGVNPMEGVIIDYYLSSKLDTPNVLTLEVLNARNEVIRTITNIPDPSFKPYPGGPNPDVLLPTEKGLNRFAWDFRKSSIPHVPDVFVMGNYQGSKVAPGKYTLKMSLHEDTVSTEVEIIPDPRLHASQQDFINQQTLLNDISATVTELHESVQQIRDARSQIENLNKRIQENEDYISLVDTGKVIIEKINKWESKLIQPKQKTFQDVINFLNQLNAELLNLKSRVDGPDPKPTAGAYARFTDLSNSWETFKTQMDQIIEVDFKNYNELYKKLEIPAIILE